MQKLIYSFLIALMVSGPLVAMFTHLGELEYRITTHDYAKLQDSLKSYPEDRSELGQLFFNEHCNEQVIRLLINAGADIDYLKCFNNFDDIIKWEMPLACFAERTPLHHHIWSGNIKEAILLVNLGAKTGVYDHRGQTAMHAILTENKNGNIAKVEDIYAFLCAVQEVRLAVNVMNDVKDRCGYSVYSFLKSEIESCKTVARYAHHPDHYQAHAGILETLLARLQAEPIASDFEEVD